MVGFHDGAVLEYSVIASPLLVAAGCGYFIGSHLHFDALGFATKQRVKRRQNEKREQRVADDPADDDGRQWPLHFRSDPGVDGRAEFNKAQHALSKAVGELLPSP